MRNKLVRFLLSVGCLFVGYACYMGSLDRVVASGSSAVVGYDSDIQYETLYEKGCLNSSVNALECDFRNGSLSFVWEEVPEVMLYNIQISEYSDFSELVYDEVVSSCSLLVEGLEKDIYYMRVRYLCSNPSYSWNDSFILKNHKHTVVVDRELTIPSTCTEYGTQYNRCSDCSNLWKEQTDLLPHEYECVETVKSTCVKEGHKTYKCVNCDASKEEKLDLISHNYVLVDSLEPSTEREGYRKYECTGCGDSYKDILRKYYPGYVSTLEIPDVGLSVPVYAGSPRQVVVDRVNSASYFYFNSQNVIADHNDQGFWRIKNAVPGVTKAKFNGRTYTCIANVQGKNLEKYLVSNDGVCISDMQGSLFMYTCNDCWRNITITAWA